MSIGKIEPIDRLAHDSGGGITIGGPCHDDHSKIGVSAHEHGDERSKRVWQPSAKRVAGAHVNHQDLIAAPNAERGEALANSRFRPGIGRHFRR